MPAWPSSSVARSSCGTADWKRQAPLSPCGRRRRGLEDRVEFLLEDYRNVSGRYDAFVSVGMLEHVGKAHYRTLGRLLQRGLAPGGP